MSDSLSSGDPASALRPQWLDPTIDLVFKLLLTGARSEGVLRYVLEAVLRPPIPIRRFTVADPTLRPNEIDEKEIVFDVRVVLEDGTEIDVEMQCSRKRAMRERLAYYAARGLSGQLEPGAPYHRLRPSIVIAFLGYREFPDGHFHKRFRLYDADVDCPFSNVLAVHTVELGKLPPLDADPDARHDPLVVFARFLTAESDTELAEIAEESPAMKQAVDILHDLSSDAAVRKRAKEREDRLKLDAMYQADAIDEAREEGREAGREEGLERGREQGHAMLLARLLERRFGPLAPETRARIERASLDELDRWADRMFAAARIEDVLGA